MDKYMLFAIEKMIKSVEAYELKFQEVYGDKPYIVDDLKESPESAIMYALINTATTFEYYLKKLDVCDEV